MLYWCKIWRNINYFTVINIKLGRAWQEQDFCERVKRGSEKWLKRVKYVSGVLVGL